MPDARLVVLAGFASMDAAVGALPALRAQPGLAAVEVGGLLRSAEASGDFGIVLRKGDPDRGSLILVVSSRGVHVAILERMLSLTGGGYEWQRVGPGEAAGSAEVQEFLARRARFDADSWLIELDIAQPERFIAETTFAG